MTERRLFESAIGLAGRLSHIPYGIDKSEDYGWRSSRALTRNAPVFRILGPCETWIPARPDHVADSLPLPGTPWEQRRRQQNWLVKNHPEASLGNYVLHDHLVEEEISFSSQHEHSWNTCLFAFGELTDTTLRRHTGTPMAVTVTGSANNVLRLTRIDRGKWAWSTEPNVSVRLSEAAMEMPTLWREEDVGAIRRVKCMVDLKRYNPTRWLAVQRDSGTTILQPEYRRAPADDGLANDALRIAPNPLFHLSKEQTGGSAHSDVSFNPSTRSNRPQLAIIDERGIWSIWDVGHTRLRPLGEPTPKLRICGHIDRGILEQLPHRESSRMMWHKILWIGRSEDHSDLLRGLDLDGDNQGIGSQIAFPPLQRSSSVLICNPQRVRLLDLVTGVYLPDLAFCRPDSLDHLLDVQVAHDPQYFYVLTTYKLFVARAYFKPGAEWDKPERGWSILFSTPHFRSSVDQSLRLAITQASTPNQEASLVFVHSSTNSWVNLFHVKFSSTDPTGVVCQSAVTALGNLQNASLGNAILALCISPTPIIVKAAKPLTRIGHDLAEKRIRLYEIAVLKSDMSLVAALCVFSLLPSTRMTMPSMVVPRGSRDRRENRINSRYLSSHFVVDDNSAASEEESPIGSHRCLKAFYKHSISIAMATEENSSASIITGGAIEHNPFDIARHSIEKASAGGPLPLHTLLKFMPDFKVGWQYLLAVGEWSSEMGRLNNLHPSVRVRALDLAHGRPYFASSVSVQDTYSRLLEITRSSFHHGDSSDANQRRIASISGQITYDLYLSLYGVGCHSPTDGQTRAQDGVDEGTLAASQAESLPSSPPRFESPLSNSWPQGSDADAIENEDPAMALLRAYTGTGKFVPHKRLGLLDKWQIGADPSDYTFDLDRDGEEDVGKLRKAKQVAREHRKRRRAETLLQLTQEPELPATQPAPDISFFSSQPGGMSSQRQVIHSDPLRVMSQSSLGPFGRLPSRKAKKRKGGF
ncbi:putative RNA polymerase i-specific transcription-initiation factor rrn6 [Rosellinia necatrix]|uniref:Putative RNA polymerase i-specific transcription-initiation factor rrn6 n=1 Tax=Rosellinia necatrix TaxID=77044 RepID=A0A1W2TL27_ROSNE|nr:putative RNA polymerase i-specific transcription-initiation factor rrn6 [Rosellinia necatrix]